MLFESYLAVLYCQSQLLKLFVWFTCKHDPLLKTRSLTDNRSECPWRYWSTRSIFLLVLSVCAWETGSRCLHCRHTSYLCVRKTCSLPMTWFSYLIGKGWLKSAFPSNFHVRTSFVVQVIYSISFGSHAVAYQSEICVKCLPRVDHVEIRVWLSQRLTIDL